MKQRVVLLIVLLSASLFARAQSSDLPVFTVVPGQVFRSAVELDAEGHAALCLDLISEKRTEFADFTKRYLDKQVQFVVDGKSVSQLIIKSQVLSGSLLVPCSSPESALAMAEHLMTKQPSNP